MDDEESGDEVPEDEEEARKEKIEVPEDEDEEEARKKKIKLAFDKPEVQSVLKVIQKQLHILEVNGLKYATTDRVSVVSCPFDVSLID